MTDPARWPAWLQLAVVALAAYRVTRLIGWDDLTAPLRARLLMPDADYWALAKDIDEVERDGLDPWNPAQYEYARVLPSRRRFYAAKLAHCPWCAGFWISVAWWVAVVSAASGTLYVAAPLALSAIVGLVAKNLDA